MCFFESDLFGGLSFRRHLLQDFICLLGGDSELLLLHHQLLRELRHRLLRLHQFTQTCTKQTDSGWLLLLQWIMGNLSSPGELTCLHALGQRAHVRDLLSVDDLVAVDEGQVGFGRHKRLTAETFEVLGTFLRHQVLQGQMEVMWSAC